MKVCPRCGILKDRKEFYKDSYSFDGLTSRCRKCTLEAEKARRVRRREAFKHLPKPTDKKCRKCGKVKLIAEFFADPAKPDGFENSCKSCNQEYDVAWKEKNQGREIKNPDDVRQCTKCKKYKKVAEFPVRRDRPGFSYNECRPCMLSTLVKWREEHLSKQ